MLGYRNSLSYITSNKKIRVMLKNMLIVLYLVIGLLGFVGDGGLSLLFIFIGFFGFSYFGTIKIMDLIEETC